MKTKKVKSLTHLLLLLPLCVVLIGAGCEKNDPKNYDPDSIIGKWEWLYTSGGFVGTTYPQKGQTETIEFTEDSVLIARKNGEITFETYFNISGDTLKYHQGTDLEYKIKISNDTLELVFIEWGLNPSYKRIK
jgi:hypothetical protein